MRKNLMGLLALTVALSSCIMSIDARIEVYGKLDDALPSPETTEYKVCVTAQVDGVDQSNCQKIEFRSPQSFLAELKFEATQTSWGPGSVYIHDIRVKGEMRRKTFGGVFRGVATPVQVTIVRTDLDYQGGSVNVLLSPAK